MSVSIYFIQKWCFILFFWFLMSQSSIFSDCLKLSKICLYIFLDRSNKLSPIFRTSKYRRLYSLIAFSKFLSLRTVSDNTLSTLLSSLLPWSKTPKIWTKNGRISAVFGPILIKPPRLIFYGSIRTCRGNLIKKYWKLNKLHFLHFCHHFYHGQNRPKFGLKMAESRPFLVQILIKLPRLMFYGSIRTCRGGLIKKYWKLNKLHFLHFCLHFYHDQNRPKFGLKMAESRPFLVQLLSNLHGLFSMDRYELAAVVWAKNFENWINYTFYTFVFNFIMVKNARNSA